MKTIPLVLSLLCWVGCGSPTSENEVWRFENVRILYEPIQGIGPETGMMRRDPSDVIKVGDTFYVWYTKVLETGPGYPEGYNGTLWFATSKDGVTWTERGEALGRGEDDRFDAFGVFTPNILYAPTNGKYYLYYTGVRIEEGMDWDFKKFSGSIGVAVADSPTGGARGWRRCNDGDPVLAPRLGEVGVFDGWHTDDTVMFYRDHQYWFYYKGHSLENQLEGTGLPPGATPMGLARSDRPDGGFKRIPFSERQPFLVQPGHELLLWPLGEGVLSLPTGHYRPEHPDDFSLFYSPDGLAFSVASPMIPTTKQRESSGLRAPGLYRPDLTNPGEPYSGPLWGLCMTSYRPGAGLQRFVLDLGD